MQDRKKIILAVVIGVLGAIFVAVYINNVEKRFRTTEDLQEVLVSMEYIPARTLVTTKNVGKISVPKQWAQPGSLTPQDRLVNEQGKSLYAALLPIEKGEQILSNKISLLGEETGLAFTIPEGKRAVSITLEDARAVAKLLKPGDFVDVIVGIDYIKAASSSGFGGGKEFKTMAIFQSVLILAVEDQLVVKKVEAVETGRDKDRRGQSSTQRGGMGGKFTVTVALLPEEVTKFIYIRDSGEVTLVLRAPGDKAEKDIPIVDLKTFIKEEEEEKGKGEKEGSKKKASAKSDEESISIIRGSQEEKIGGRSYQPFPK